MAKAKTIFQCNECGYEVGKWMGKCPSCGEWNTLIETIQEPLKKGAATKSIDTAKIVPLKQVEGGVENRISTQIGELDRVLGGGIVPGSVVLAGGEPGIGKSTLFLQMADNLAKKDKVLYVSAEESAMQVGMRFTRLGLQSDLAFLAETDLGVILAGIEADQPKFVIIDSIQTIYNSDMSSAAGSVSQVRECASTLARLAKTRGIAVFIIGHVTKEGNLAGPRVLEHLVDTVLYFEGEASSAFRILRAVKNRFGSTNEIGVFDMSASGMQEVKNPSAALLSARQKQVAGSAIYCALEGTRPVLIEVEALVSETAFGNPRRMATGVDYNRMSLIIAVLEKKIGLKLYNQDIYVNVGGGMRIADTALDLAIAASIVSSFRNRPIQEATVIMGEIGLTGEVRHVAQMEKRINEAERMGMEKVLLPAQNKKGIKTDMQVIALSNVSDALSALF